MFKGLIDYKSLFVDLENRKFLFNQIKKFKGHDIFKENDIFVRRGRELCVIISLSKNEIEASNEIDDTERQLMFEDYIMYQKMERMNTFLTKEMKCGELFTPIVKKLPNSYSYKLVYKPYYLVLSLKFIISNVLLYSSFGLLGGLVIYLINK